MASMDAGMAQTQDDILLIAVMGVTGSGKSNFLKHLTDAAGLESGGPVVGQNLESCTQKTETFAVNLQGRRFIFFDTPGFDDTYRGDGDILIDIAETLSTSYKKNLKLSGIIYLHRIKDERVTNGIQRNFNMFRYLCGDNFFGNVLLVTTFWDELTDERKGEERELALLKKPDWWGEMRSKGSKIRRFNNTQQCALDLIWEVVGLPPVVLQVQKEMVEDGLNVEKTTAGTALNQELSDLRATFEEEIKALHEKQEKARLEHNEALRLALEAKEEETQARIKDLESESAAFRAENREERRRREQEFTDQIMRLERDKRTLDERMQTLETQAQLQQESAKNRMDDVLDQLNDALAQLKNHKSGQAAEIAKLENEKKEVEVLSREWKSEMERLTAEIQNMEERQKQSSSAERSYFESRLEEMRSEKVSKTSSFWMSLSSLSALGNFLLNIFD